MAQFCTALQACRLLTHLKLWRLAWNITKHRSVVHLLDTAAALPVLSELDISYTHVERMHAAAAGQALGALLAADLPSLRTLCVHSCGLGDEGLAPLLDGLAANTHLRELECVGNNLSEAFVRDRLTPALAALAARANNDA